MPPPKTLKQAKASFKTRSAASNPLSEREQKQLARAAQLERRAWGLREREKARGEAVRRRGERERAEREERKARTRDGEGGEERRKDRHGFLASQMCLGAFFGRGGGVREGRGGGGQDVGKGAGDGGRVGMEEVGSDMAEEDLDDVDDDSLLQALKSPELQRTKPDPPQHGAAATAMPPPPIPRQPQAQQRQPLPRPPAPERRVFDLQDFDFLDSSTQIARELSPPASKAAPTFQPGKKEAGCNTSFDSGSFDLTEEDLEELDPTPPARMDKRQDDSKKTLGGKETMMLPALPPRLGSGGRNGGSPEDKIRLAMMQPLPGAVAGKRAYTAGSAVSAERKRMPPPAPRANNSAGPTEAGRQAGKRASMPPPALPARKSEPLQGLHGSAKQETREGKSMPPPALPALQNKPFQPPSVSRDRVAKPLPHHRKKHTPSKPAAGADGPLKTMGKVQVGQSKRTTKAPEQTRASFTLTELESFVEDDLVLTQAC